MNRVSFFDHRWITWLVGGFLVLFFWATYWFLGPREMVNYADANDLILAAIDLGLAHPPGYPLYVWLLHGWMRLLSGISWMNPTIAATGLSALFMALAVGGVFGMVINVGRRRFFPRQHVLFGLIAAVMVGSHPLLWKLALVPEVMTLSVWFVVMAGWWAARIWFSNSTGWDLFLFGFLIAMGGLHHPLVLPLMGLLVAAVWRRLWHIKRNYFFGLGLVTAILLTVGLYAGLAVFSRGYGWEVPSNVAAWWQFWSRSVYTDQGSAIELFSADGRFDLMVVSLWKWMKLWFIDWWGGLSLIGLMVLGWFLKKRNQLFLGILILLAWFGYGPVIALYMRHPEVYSVSETGLWWGVALRERMFYPFVLVQSAVLVSLVISIWHILLLRFHRLSTIFLAVILIGLGFLYRNLWERLRLSEGNSASVYVKQVLEQLPAESVLLVDSDEVFSLLYGQRVQDLGAGVTILPTRMILEQEDGTSFAQALSRNGFSVNTQGYVADAISLSLAKGMRVYVYSMDSAVLEFVGVEGNPYYGIPYGYSLEITDKPPQEITVSDYGISVQLASLKTESADYWFKGFRTHLAEIHTQQAYFLARVGLYETAAWHEHMATDLVYTDRSREEIVASTSLGKERFETLGNYLIQPPLPVEWWLLRAQEAYAKRYYKQAAYALERAMLLDSEAVYQQVDPRGIWIAAYGKEIMGQHPMWDWGK